jgi:plastocyanin
MHRWFKRISHPDNIVKVKNIFVLILIVSCVSCTPANDTPTFGYTSFIVPSEEDVVLKGALTHQGTGVHRIDIMGMAFEPASIKVNKGDTLLWVNKDFYAHDVTELKAKKWQSPKLEPGSSWAMVVNEEAEYFCSIHVVMKGSIGIKANL